MPVPSRNKISYKICMALLTAILLAPANSFALFKKDATGGMSEIRIADTGITVDGGFVQYYESDEISIRSKGVELSINIDNSLSEEDRKYRFIINNVNPEIYEIVGWEGDEVEKGANSISFNADVKAKKVAVYKLAPKVENDDYIFMVFGESQGGEHVFNRILGDINYRKPLFAISLGDMLEDASPGSYEDFLEKINLVKVPFLTAVGSIERQNGGSYEYANYLGASYYSFDYKDSHFVILDNGSGLISEEQFLWLENDLMQKKLTNNFVFMHIPPFDPRPGGAPLMKTGGQHLRLSRILKKYNVSMAFTSGIHGYFSQDYEGIPYIITGGGGSELASPDSFYNYVIVEVKGDKVKDKLIKLASPSLGWFQSIKLNAKIYVKNYYQESPVWTIVYSIVILLILFYILKFIKNMIFKPARRRKISL